MGNNMKERRVVKAHDALAKAKLEEKEVGTPVPQKLRDDLRKAIADYENDLKAKND